MKTLFINGRFLTQPLTGVQRYAHEVIRAFDQLMDDGTIDLHAYQIVVLVPPDTDHFPQYKHVQVRKIGRLKGNLWEQISLARYAFGKMLFNPCNTGPVLGGMNQSITIHDASVYAVPEAYSWTFRLKYHVIYKVFGVIARHIFTVSEFSRKEINKYCGISTDKIQVVPGSGDHILRFDRDNSIFDKFGFGAKPYLLAVSNNSPHKNFKNLLFALQLLEDVDFDVIIAGGNFDKVFSSQDYQDPPFVKRVGYVTDEQLRSLYEKAVAFVYPSLYEGFGLPPLEAMECGCPVILSNAASLPEVGGESARYFDPHNIEEMSANITGITNLRQKTNYQKAAMSFRWDKTARSLWQYLFASNKKYRHYG